MPPTHPSLAGKPRSSSVGRANRRRFGACCRRGSQYLFSGRVHYAWVVLAVVFTATLAGVGVRAAPGVMILPLQHAFGWDVSTISGAISINIILLGATAPFITGLMEVIGLKRTILRCMVVLMAGTGLSTFMTSPWQLFLTWGLMVGIGSGAGAVGIAAAVANRWFAERAGLAMGLLFAATAAGQLVFLPLLAMLARALRLAGRLDLRDAGGRRHGCRWWRCCCRSHRRISD